MTQEELIKMLVWAFNTGYDAAFKLMDSVRDKKINEDTIVEEFQAYQKSMEKKI